MDEIRGSPARRLSQILDPIARLTSELSSSTSAPCSPRMGSRRHESCCAATTSSSGPSSLGDSPRMMQRRGGRQGPTPPPRPRLSNNSPVHYRDSPYVNVPNLVFQKDKSFAESAKNAGYTELKESPPSSAGPTPSHGKSRTSPFNFTSEPSGRVEYVDTRLPFVDFGPTSYENKAHELQAYARGRSPFEPSTSSTASCSSSRSPFYTRQQAESQSRPVVHQETAQAEPKAAFASSKSFDGYANTVEELNWQERCLELQLELHRSRNQASRVRDMLREKIVSNKNFDPNLIESIEKGKNTEAKLLLQRSSDRPRDTVDDTGSTLLYYAVKFNNVEMVRHLVHLGCEYDAYNNERDTPLMLAVLNNRKDLVETLLNRVDISFSDNHFKKLLETMFDHQTRPEIVKLVLDKLKKFDDKKLAKVLLDTKCPLYNSVLLNRVAVVKAMMDNGFSINVKNPFDGNSPLHVAVACGNLNLVRLLIEHGADINAANNKGEIPLNRKEDYCSSEELEILKILVSKRSLLTSRENSGCMQIHRLFERRNAAAMKIVLLSNIDLNAQDSNGYTVMHYFASNMKTEILPLLIDRNFNPNIQNRWGYTPLHFMAFSHDLNAIRLLFKKGADVNVTTHENRIPPLHNLIISYKCGRNMSTDCVQEFIVEQGADIQFAINNNLTVFNSLHFYEDHELSSIIVPHLALLEAQGTTIIEPLRRQIDSTDWIKCGIESYRSKLERLKTVGVHESVTIFNLLIDSERRIISYLRNKQLATKLRRVLKSNIHGIHQFHVELLKKRVNKALDIIKWQQKATVIFSTIVVNHVRFADFIINEVMVYLSLEDIKNLASVKCSDQNISKHKSHSRKSTRKRK